MKKATYLFVCSLTICLSFTISQAALIQVPGEQATIQAGIDAAVEGDTVLVADGTYIGTGNKDLDYGGKAIVVLSENGPESTVINPMHDGRGVTFDDGETSEAVFDGFTIQYGRAGYAGGIYCANSSPTIRNCIINYCVDTGLYCLTSDASIENCLIKNSEDEGCLCGQGYPVFTNCTIMENGDCGFRFLDIARPILIGCNISQNSTVLSGGGIRCDYSFVTIIGSSITHNTSGIDGGGVHGTGMWSLTIDDSIISGNSAEYDGGGISCSQSRLSTISNCQISGNYADNGGGLYSFGTSMAISDCDFIGNIAGLGGGIYCYEDSQTVTNCIFSENVANRGGGISGNAAIQTFDDCDIIDNLAHDSGGGIYFFNETPEVLNCVVSQNTANISGGGIFCWQASPALTNNIILGNYASNGGGIGCDESSPIISFCTVSGNEANNGGGLGCGWDSYPSISACIIWRNTPDEIFVSSGMPTVVYSNVQGGWEGEGNIDLDPFFTDPAEGDYHLTISSPCIEAGIDVGVNDDWDGEVRPNGEGFDIGMDEYYSSESIEVLLIDCPESVPLNDTLLFSAGVINTSLVSVQFDQVKLYVSGPLSVEKNIYSGSTYGLAPSGQISRSLSLFVPETVITGWYIITIDVLFEDTSFTKASFFVEVVDS